MRSSRAAASSPAVLAGQLAIAIGHALVWWQPLVGAIGVAGAWWVGRRTGDTPRGWWRWVVPALSGAAVTLLVLLGRQVATVEAVVATAVLVLLAAVPFELGRFAVARTEHEERGWRLYRSTQAEQAAVRAQAEAGERARIAADMHDALGHEMALIALRCSALQVQAERIGRHEPDGGTAVAGELAQQVDEIRQAAAAATDRLHEIVNLLDEATSTGTGVAATIERARDAGLVVNARVDDVRRLPLSTVASDQVLRVVREGLTNAAKHAPGEPVEVVAVPDDDARRVRLSISNRFRGEGASTVGSRRGLAQLADRLAATGGELVHLSEDDAFTVVATIPCDAGSDPGDTAVPGPERQRRRTVVVPVTVVIGALIVLVSWFVAVTVGSVLAPATYAAISVGDDQDATDDRLPPFTLPDAPQTVPESTADCRYFESEVSFFRRATTYQLCFANGRLASKRELAPQEAR